MELLLNGSRYDFFNDVDVTLSFDSVASTFGFSFLPNDFKDLKSVLKYPSVKVIEGRETLIFGTIINNTFNSKPTKSLTAISGYSNTGILQDCTTPVNIYPLQSDNLTLLQIARKLTQPFNVGVVVDSLVQSEVNQVFEKSELNATETIASYLSSLATQKNIVLSHDNKGNIVFTKAKTNQKPVETLTTALSMQLSINGQQLHRTITVVKQPDTDGGNAGQSTITNPYCSINRTKTVTQNKGNDNDTNLVARAVLGAELKNIKLTISLDRWVDINGNLFKPNTLISIINQDLLIFDKTNFFIESVNFVRNSNGKSCTLNCVLPAVYDNTKVLNIFE